MFCIDVRSEVFRRQLEASALGIETIGFAAFFAFAVDDIGVGQERHDTQCPVLLTPTHTWSRGRPTRRISSVCCRVVGLSTKCAERLAQLDAWLVEAGRLTRAERARRLPMSGVASIDKAIVARSKDRAQLRPECGLAGCSAFIVAPRERTVGLDLRGRSFLHSYDWRKDDGFGVLELIMTAPMVVGSWISLQYYASTVDNRVFGAGNKTLHNVVGRVGVYEGNAGDLRVGLPGQTVHDGERFQHDHLRLNVVIEASIDAMNGVLEKHASVRDLCDNGWVQLLAMDDNGCISHRYTQDLEWERPEKEARKMAAAA